ncbi:hypothetical protein ACFTAO_31725 [Paenibacillus rhizoplanae]
MPTDCPQRDERLGWTGDAQMFIRTAAYLMNVAPFSANGWGDLAADQREDGGVPYVIPHVLGGGGTFFCGVGRCGGHLSVDDLPVLWG